MMHCPKCGCVAHVRTSRYVSNSVKERYHQCQNHVCAVTFSTHESVHRIITSKESVDETGQQN
ncbi:ogr/Delta-like zinc finger family protein [Serratia sp. 1D1416]|uniref:ogr/Delta-like zinc finger family protein n=1 Tax=Serratia sp. 1D1416 TaxID=2447890 RepID=UPI001013CE13|nr:ogr/Delta-like zinc finger family protein [Serratia sp. 1D1416]